MRIPALLALWLAFASVVTAADYTRTEDVIYGRKFGTALTLDVIQPKKPNGFAILFMVSGGFFSSHENINPETYIPFLERGYTVFAVVHGSQPRFIIPEIEQDIHRAVRFVRHNAAKWHVSPDRFGRAILTRQPSLPEISCNFQPAPGFTALMNKLTLLAIIALTMVGSLVFKAWQRAPVLAVAIPQPKTVAVASASASNEEFRAKLRQIVARAKKSAAERERIAPENAAASDPTGKTEAKKALPNS